MNAWGPSMNDWGLLLAWSAVQVGVLLVAGAGVYLVVRRRNPAAGAWAIAAVLVAAVGLSGIALSPLPQWWSVDDVWSPNSETSTVAAASLQESPAGGAAGEGSAKRNVEIAQSPTSDAALSAAWREFLAGFQQSLQRDEASRAWRWPAWLAVAVLVCIGLGLVRLGVALFAVRRYGARAGRVDDVDARALLAEIKRELGCARRIELRESAGLGSPCTLGWVRPVVILPGDWRTWSESELRPVLAHEVAHVARGDFAVGILSQVGVALHFYNPLVWWLAGRLRLEQEMAADLCGARLAGGRETYLTTLARMALRQSDLPLAARAFLPARGTLLRRVEMLHKGANGSERAMSWRVRGVVVILLVLTGGLLAGLRGPSPSVAIAAATEPPAAAGVTVAEEPVEVRLKAAEARVKETLETQTRLEHILKSSPTAIADVPGLEKAYDEAKRNRKEAESALAAVEGELGPAQRAARLRMQSNQRLRNIGIAFQNYHDVNKRFPAAVEIGPDGKTPHSWRVAILPYLDEEVAKRYRLNEPRDSEHNKQVMADGAELFAVPAEPASQDCGYFVLVGPGSVFHPANKGTGIRAIRDGTSKTIGVVEAKRSIPWTKPEDIAYSADKPLPKLGGFFEGGFNAMGLDSAVHFIPSDIDEAVLRALITKDGRERVGWDDRRLGLQKESE